MSSILSSPPDPLRVLLDIRILQGEDAFRGIGHYTRGLTQALLALARKSDDEPNPTPSLEAHLVVDEERPAPSLDTTGAATVHAIAAPAPPPAGFPARWFARSPADVRGLARLARRIKARVVHYASPLHGPFNPAALSGVATVATLYDLIPLLDHEHYLDAWPADLARRYQERLRALPSLSGFVAISATVAHDATRLLGIRADRMPVAYPALRRPFRSSGGRPEKSTENDAGYMMGFASLNPSKHTELLLEAYAGLGRARREAHPLRLVGPADPELTAWLGEKAKQLAIRDQLEWTPQPNDETLADLYRGAYAFILPSRAEGFAIPALEAMACGCPVIASDIAVCREVLAGAAGFFDADRPDGLTHEIERIIREPDLRDGMMQKGRSRAAEFSWERSARTVLALYCSLAGRG